MSDDIELPDGVDESEREAWQAWLANGMNEDAEEFRDAYAGEYATLEDYAYEFISDCYEVPEWVENYIDYKSFARDLDLGGDIWYGQNDYGVVYVFRNI